MKKISVSFFLLCSFTALGNVCSSPEEKTADEFLSISTFDEEKWGNCTSGPYYVSVTARAGVSDDIDSCFHHKDLISTNDINQAKEAYSKYNFSRGKYYRYVNFHGNTILENHCRKKFPKLPVLLENYAVRVLGYNKLNDLTTCEIKYPSRFKIF